jgi:hypothetical protein
MKYIIHHGGEQRGPWSFDEVVRGLETQNINWTDYVFDNDVNDWVMLMEFRPLSENLKSFFQSKAKPGSPSAPVMRIQEMSPVEATSIASIHSKDALKEPQENEWYVLRDEDKFGPFKYLELIRMLQEKKLFEFEFVWFKGMGSWQKISDLADFAPAKIKQMHDSGQLDGLEIFFRRKHKRAKLGATVIVHDQKKVYKAVAAEISAGGCGVVLNQNEIDIGKSLHLHFKAGDEVPAFNATVEVVSRRKLQGRETRYGFKFLEIAPSVQKAIKDYTKKVA